MTSPQAAEYAREQMVSQQIRAWDVLDEQILNLFRQLTREQFVPAAYRDGRMPTRTYRSATDSTCSRRKWSAASCRR